MQATRTTVVNDAARAMDALRRIVHALHSANARAQSNLRVTAAQLFVLRQIALEPGISMTRLAQRTRSAPSSVSEVVSRLVGEGLVNRRVSVEDGRRAELTLSRAGAIIARNAGETIQERLVAAYEELEADDRAALAGLLEEWLAAAGLEDGAATFFFTDG
ncbi:MAG TPA: MarR family transcriptional regulator [Gemmatimonadaceae bacterium]|nr:MarR family transcriptional regulator [Gemmatimonadaceae bacterium]